MDSLSVLFHSTSVGGSMKTPEIRRVEISRYTVFGKVVEARRVSCNPEQIIVERPSRSSASPGWDVPG